MDELLEGTECTSCPRLDIGNKIGSTNYIDFITVDDMTDNIMIGEDYAGRQFIAIKALYERKGKSKEIVCTFFQRYSDSNKVIGIGTCYNGLTYGLCNNTYVPYKEVDDLVERILLLKRGETLVFDDSTYTFPRVRRAIQDIVTDVLYKDVSSIVLGYI